MEVSANWYLTSASAALTILVGRELEFPIPRRSYSTEAQLRAIVFDYIEVWYNRKRRHSSLGYVSPAQFVQKLAVQH